MTIGMVILALAGLATLGLWLGRNRLIEGARNWWRFWSTRLQLVCAMLTAWLFFDPGSLLAAWNMMPAAVRELLPDRFLQAFGALLFVLNVASVLARQVKQPKLDAQKKESTDGE